MNNISYDKLDDIFKFMIDEFEKQFGKSELTINNEDLIVSFESESGREEVNFSSLRRKFFESQHISSEEFKSLYREKLKKLPIRANMEEFAKTAPVILRPVKPTVLSSLSKFTANNESPPVLYEQLDGVYAIYYLDNEDYRQLIIEGAIPNYNERLARRYTTHEFELYMHKIDVGMVMDDDDGKRIITIPELLLILRQLNGVPPQEIMDTWILQDARGPYYPTQGVRIYGTDVFELLINPDTRRSFYEEVLKDQFEYGQSVVVIPITQDYILVTEYITDNIDLPETHLTHLYIYKNMTGTMLVDSNLLFQEYPSITIKLEGNGKFDLKIKMLD